MRRKGRWTVAFEVICDEVKFKFYSQGIWEPLTVLNGKVTPQICFRRMMPPEEVGAVTFS